MSRVLRLGPDVGASEAVRRERLPEGGMKKGRAVMGKRPARLFLTCWHVAGYGPPKESRVKDANKPGPPLRLAVNFWIAEHSRKAMILGMLLCAIAGCSTLPSSIDKPLSSGLGLAPLGAEAVALDICSIILDESQAAEVNEIWQHLDEQVLTLEQRMLLTQNGFRCGTVGMKLPDCVLKALGQSTEQKVDSIDSPQAASGVTVTGNRQGQRLKISEGRETILVTAETQPEIAILVADQGKVNGKVFRDAQTVLSLNTRAVGDGDVELKLIPEVHHGPARQKIVGSDGTLRMESSREREIFANLTIQARLSPGQTVVLSSIGPEASLGGRFFGGHKRRKLMLIRLVTSKQDRLFSLWTEQGKGKEANAEAVVE
jgi:hypothetical protein